MTRIVVVAIGVVTTAGLGILGAHLAQRSPTSSSTPTSTQTTTTAATSPTKNSSTSMDASEVNPATLMMGGDPSRDLIRPTDALRGTTNNPHTGHISTPPIAGLEGLVKLDPICDTMQPPSPKLPPGNPAPSTRRMAERLVEIGRKSNPKSAGYLSDRLAEQLHAQLTNATEAGDQFRLQFQLGIQQVNSARPDSALNTFSSLERLVAESGGSLDDQTRAELRLRKGMAFFRLGEQENCLATHNADSCVFPLTPKAQHLLPRGSRGAIAMFAAHLAEYPNDYSTRWLLNLAHMTLGEYPDKVDPQYLIPPERFASEYSLPRFIDVSDGLGIDANDLAGGCIVEDFDNDGFYDLVISAWDLKGQLRYFHNNGNGTFSDRTSEAGLVGEVGSLNIQQTDYNNDGWPDIWALRGAWLGEGGLIPNSLLRNNGDGTFTDVTEEAGLLSFHPTQASRWFDYDGDGWLDLFIGNESTDPRNPHPCELYHNNRNGTFTECARASGIEVAAFVKGVACADYDNDGRPDLYLSMRGNRAKVLLHNEGPDSSGQWRFRDAAAQAGVDNKALTFATFFFDYDNDGWEDLMVFGYYLPRGVGDIAMDYLGLPNRGEKPIVYHNNRNGTFTDVTAAVHMNRICLSMGHNYGDIDNDGWLDFYLGTGDPDLRTLIPNRMFRNDGGRAFQEVTSATGTGHIQKGHGVAFADFDDDGDQDLYSAMGGAYSGDFARNALFMNPGSTNRWLKLKLVGRKANRAAIGARLKLTVQTSAGPRELHRVVSSGGNFGSNPLRQEVGLGQATAITEVEILWPGSGTRQHLTGLELNRSYQIREDDPVAIAQPLHPVNLLKHPPAVLGGNLQARQ